MTCSFFVVCHWLCKHCADLQIHILKTIKPINKTHNLFFLSEDRFFWNQKSTSKVCHNFVLFLVSWQFDSHSFFETLTCFFWLSKYDLVLRIYFKRDTFITPCTHEKQLCDSNEFSFPKNRKKNICFSWNIKETQYLFFLNNPTFTNTQTNNYSPFCFVFLFVWFDKCWIEWQVLFCFLFFLGLESSMTNKRLMSMWWSLSLLWILVMDISGILLCDSKNTKWKRRKMKLESNTQHIFFSFHPKKKTHLSPFQTLFLTLFQTLKTTHKSFFPSFFCFCWVRFALVVIFPVCLSHGNAKKKMVTIKTQNFKTKASSPVPFLIFLAVVDQVLHVVNLPFVLHVFSVLAVLVSISDFVVFSLCFSATLEKEIELVLCFFFGKKQTNKPPTAQWLWSALFLSQCQVAFHHPVCCVLFCLVVSGLFLQKNEILIFFFDFWLVFVTNTKITSKQFISLT